jgi:hypothetical protein
MIRFPDKKVFFIRNQKINVGMFVVFVEIENENLKDGVKRET